MQAEIERVQAEDVRCLPLTKLGKPAYLICELAARALQMGTQWARSPSVDYSGLGAYQVLAQSPVPVTLIK